MATHWINLGALGKQQCCAMLGCMGGEAAAAGGLLQLQLTAGSGGEMDGACLLQFVVRQVAIVGGDPFCFGCFSF